MAGIPGHTAKIDPKQVELLATVGCSYETIAGVLGCSHDTLQRRFKSRFQRGQSHLRMNLHRKQHELAMAGDRTMLIWLGKQYLGQKDRAEHNLSGGELPLSFELKIPPTAGGNGEADLSTPERS